MHHFVDHLAALDCDVRCTDSKLVGLARVLGVLFHGGSEFLHAGSGLLQDGGLLLGALREIGVACGDLLGSGVDGIGGILDLPHQILQVSDGAVHAGLHFAERTWVVLADGLGQIALGQYVGHTQHVIQSGLGDGRELVEQLG